MGKTESKPQWFSIKEAANFLEVGEPTIYRWMREGLITYRKVGDSTRFVREDLESMVQVFHCRREADKVRLVCSFCHHNEMVEGRAQSMGLIYFRPKKTKFWTLKEGHVETQARMCTRCGAITWFGNVATLMALRKGSGADGEEGKNAKLTQRESGNT